MLSAIKEIKEIAFDEKLNEITNKLPENSEICKSILKKLNNENVQIKEQDSKEASLYIVSSNTILIANIKNSFTRVQTIAHECLHSIQNKKLLWFNFIFSNIYILFCIVITILALLNKIQNGWIYAFILLFMGFIYYGVRSYLEMDAMTKAKYVAKEYMEDNLNLISKDEIELITKQYDNINKKGIGLTMIQLAAGCIFKLIIFAIAIIF